MNGASTGYGPDTWRDLVWSPTEKRVARQAFDLALHRELEDVMIESKKKAELVKQPSQLWELEKSLTDAQTHIDRQFDYRYSVLIQIFGELMYRKRLNEEGF